MNYFNPFLTLAILLGLLLASYHVESAKNHPKKRMFLGVKTASRRSSKPIKHVPIPSEDEGSEKTRLGFQTVIFNSDLDMLEYETLRKVNKDLRQAVDEKPKFKHFLSVVKGDEEHDCTKNLFYGNHQIPATKSNPIKFLYPLHANPVDNGEIHIAGGLLHHGLSSDIECLDQLVEKKSYVDIVTCYDRMFENHTQCANFKKDLKIYYNVRIDSGFPITRIRSIEDSAFVKRRLLFGAIFHDKQHLVDYLLSPSQQTEVGREHLVIALYTGQESLFFRLIRPFRGNNATLRSMLRMDLSFKPRDLADIVTRRWDYQDEHTPSKGLLNWLFAHIPVQEHHIGFSARKSESRTLTYLLSRTKKTMGEVERNQLLVNSLEYAVRSEYMSNFKKLINEITDWSIIDNNMRRQIIRVAISNRKYKDIFRLLSEKTDVTIRARNLIQAVQDMIPFERIQWMVDNCVWAGNDINTFMNEFDPEHSSSESESEDDVPANDDDDNEWLEEEADGFDEEQTEYWAYVDKVKNAVKESLNMMSD